MIGGLLSLNRNLLGINWSDFIFFIEKTPPGVKPDRVAAEHVSGEGEALRGCYLGVLQSV